MTACYRKPIIRKAVPKGPFAQEKAMKVSRLILLSAICIVVAGLMPRLVKEVIIMISVEIGIMKISFLKSLSRTWKSSTG